MAAILFTDADGTWKLHNAKPFPGDRFGNWTPDSVPFGDSAPRLSDGALTMFRLRTDFGASFEVRQIPSKRSSNLVLQSENFGTTWSPSGTPTRVAAAHTISGISLDLIGDDSGVAEEFYEQTIAFTGNAAKGLAGFFREGTSPAASGSQFVLNDATAGVDRLKASLTWASGVPTVSMITGSYLGSELYVFGVYRLLFTSTSVIAANTNKISVRPAGAAAEQGNLYAGGIQAENNVTPRDYLYTTTTAIAEGSLIDIADRLRRHLLNGGTCQVIVSDGGPAGGANSQYATCGLKPGTTPTLQLEDRRTLEFTLSLHLINLAVSPTAMVARYAEF